MLPASPPSPSAQHHGARTHRCKVLPQRSHEQAEEFLELRLALASHGGDKCERRRAARLSAVAPRVAPPPWRAPHVGPSAAARKWLLPVGPPSLPQRGCCVMRLPSCSRPQLRTLSQLGVCHNLLEKLTVGPRCRRRESRVREERDQRSCQHAQPSASSFSAAPPSAAFMACWTSSNTMPLLAAWALPVTEAGSCDHRSGSPPAPHDDVCCSAAHWV